MRADELTELHYITHMANLTSILVKGILSHKDAARQPHQSVAMPEIQERREDKAVPGGLPLHDYVNLYMTARNPMMYVRRQGHLDLCVLRISTNVLYWDGVVIASSNASSQYTRFAASPEGLALVDSELVFAEYWTDPDPVVYYRKKAAKCAEVLVPRRVAPEYIVGAYVSCDAARRAIAGKAPDLPTAVDAHLFFRQGG